jgi:uncharacterized protein (TIGR02246 family)
VAESTPWAVLLQAYGAHFDARDPEQFATLFTDDATIVTPFGKDLVGRDRIEGMVTRTPAGGRHQVGEPDVIHESEDTATTRTAYSAEMSDGTKLTGSYEDTFRLTAEGWRIERHVISITS